PLEASTIATFLHYITPTVQSLPPHILTPQLAFRHSCLHLTPDDPVYLLWPSTDEQHVRDALESIQQKHIDDIPLDDFRIQYTADDSLLAHVELTPDLRLVFQWDEGSWKYSNAALMPFPRDCSPSIDALPDLALDDADDREDTPDSYWDSYKDTEPDPEGAAEGLERESSDSYWDMYNSVQGSGDSAIPSPAPEKQRHDRHPIQFSYADIHPATDPMESLSDRLEALSRRSGTPGPDEEEATTVVNGGDALKETLRGVWRLWRSAPTLADRELFLNAVHEVLAEP
ncbi:hypothetical protein GGX14DRAFT_639127, partial [Mycena pura]